MLFSSSSSSFSSDDGYELSSGRSSVSLEGSEASFVPYNENLEPLATAEEAAAYEANMALEEEQELEFRSALYGRSRRRYLVCIPYIVVLVFVSLPS